MEELLVLLLEFCSDFILQMVFELLAELGLRGWRRRPKVINPFVASIGYVLLGAAVGLLSVWIFPTLLIRPHFAQIIGIVAVPALSGASMAWIGRWRQRRGQSVVLIDRFAYGFLFAFAMGLVRLRFGV